MCVIVYKPADAPTLPFDILQACFTTNRDGAGFAYIHEGKVHWSKGYFNVDLLNKALMEIPADAETVVHFRIATQGLVDVANTHPFPVSEDASLYEVSEYSGDVPVLFHNGVLSIGSIKDRKSDTWQMTEDILTQALDPGVVLDWLAEESHSRFAYVAPHGVTRHGDWQRHEDWFFSNLSWRYTAQGHARNWQYYDLDDGYYPMGSAYGIQKSNVRIMSKYSNCDECNGKHLTADLTECEECSAHVCEECAYYDLDEGKFLCQTCARIMLNNYPILKGDKIIRYSGSIALAQAADKADDKTALCYVCDRSGKKTCTVCQHRFCSKHITRRRGEHICYACEWEFDEFLKGSRASLFTPSEYAGYLAKTQSVAID